MLVAPRKIVRPVRLASLCAIALAVMLPVAPASAELLVTPDNAMGGVDSLRSWSYIVDGMSIQLFEEWEYTAPVAFFIEDDGLPFSGGTLIDIKKDILNVTDFDWTDFHIDLFPRPGSDGITVDAASVFSDRFSDVMVMNNDDGSASIWYFTDGAQGDTPVLIGETVSLSFTMNILGNIAFNMVQTPSPTPGALALFALAGVAMRRRRRN